MTYPEPQQSIVTHRGKVEKKSPRHYEVSKKSTSTTLSNPLPPSDNMIKLVHFTDKEELTPETNNFYGGMLFFKFNEIKNDIDKLSFEFHRNPVFFEIEDKFIFEFQKIEGGYTEYIVYNEDIHNLRNEQKNLEIG